MPAIVRFISGYIQGAKKANPKIKVLANYANDNTFSDQAKCKETALGQIQQGSRAIFQVAGGCGLGALSAAQEAGIWGIGVDADQLYSVAHDDERAQGCRTRGQGPHQARLRAGTSSRRDYNYNLGTTASDSAP